MPFYRYYQKSEKTTWEVTTDVADAAKYQEMGAKRVSILALDSPIVEGVDKKVIKYKGPMYFDIDHKDLKIAISSTQRLVKRLLELEVPEYSMEVYCSGAKGFHVYVHAQCFTNSRAMRNLPRFYKKLATCFHVPGLDYQPYSSGKGNLFRLPNVKREKDGKYKVRISLEELQNITPEKYEELVSEPRSIAFMPMRKPEIMPARTAVLFHEAQLEVRRELSERGKHEQFGISSEKLKSSLPDLPPCATSLASGNIKNSVNFNQAALQLAVLLSAYKPDPAVSANIVSRFASSTDSSSYKTEEDRASHVFGLIGYVETSDSFSFSCGPMVSVLSSRPCSECVLKSQTSQDSADYDIIEDTTGYYYRGAKENRQLTNFTLVPVTEIGVTDEATGGEIRDKVIAQVYSMDEMIGVVDLGNDAWASRRQFIGALGHLGKNIAAYLSDNEVQKLKEYVLRDLDEVDYQIQVTSLGIYRDTPRRSPRYTWVEKGLSVNKWGMKDTHVYSRTQEIGRLSEERMNSMPQYNNIPPLQVGDKRVEEAVGHLLEMNTKEVVAPIIGWHAATSLKSHLMGRFGQFPLLNLWGGRGSGKTRTAVIFSNMCGSNYMDCSPHVASSSSLFPIYMELSSTTTIPRIVDEFNRAGCGNSAYTRISEALKQAYMGASVHRGALGKGGKGITTVEWPMTSPTIFLSEHIPDVPALVDRSVTVMLSEPNLSGRKKHERFLGRHYKELWPLARALAMEPLNMHEEGLLEPVEGWEDKLPEALSDRQRYASAVVLYGLDYFKSVLNKFYDVLFDDKIAALQDAYLESLSGISFSLVGGGSSTEVDAYLRRLSDMCMLLQTGHIEPSMQPLVTAVRRDGDVLKIDVPVVFTIIRNYLSKVRARSPLGEPAQFMALLRNEPYFLRMEEDAVMSTTRKVAVLDIGKLSSKGVDVSAF